MPKTLDATDSKDAKNKVGDLEVFGDPDMWKLICKASSRSEGWMKSTKGLNIPGAGVLILVTTQQGAHVSEALAWIPRVSLVPDDEKQERFVLIGETDYCPELWEPFGTAPVPKPRRAPEPLPEVVENLFKLLIKRTEKQEEREERRQRWRDRDERREKVRETRRVVWHFKDIADLYERRAHLLELAKKHFDLDKDDICGCAASDAAEYLMKAIEEEKRLHAEKMDDPDL